MEHPEDGCEACQLAQEIHRLVHGGMTLTQALAAIDEARS